MAFIAVSLGASLFVSLVLFEFGARIIDSQRSDRPQRRERLDLLTTNPNGTGSYRLKPDIDLVTRIDGREVRIRTNRHGMHWRDVTIRKNDGRRPVPKLGPVGIDEKPRLSKSGVTLAHEQVTRRPPTLDCGSTFERAAGR